MSYKESIPGMEPDNRKRNIIVGGGYILLLLVILANFASIIALLLLLSPVVVAILIGKDYKGSASEMARLPGIRDGGGIQAGISAFVYTIVFVGVLMGGLTAFAPVDDASEEEGEVAEGEGEAEATETEATEEEDEAEAEAAEDDISTVTITVVDENGDPVENADVEFVHDDAIIFDTRENKPTNSDGIVEFETETGSNVEINVEADGYENTDARLTVSEDEEITLTLQEEPEDTEQDTEPAEEDQQNTEAEASEDSGSDEDGESDSDESDESTASDSSSSEGDSSDSSDDTDSDINENEDVTIVDHELQESVLGWEVVVIVENTSGEMQDYIQVEARFYDEDGVRIDEWFNNATDVEPGERVEMTITTTEDEEPADYELEASTSPF